MYLGNRYSSELKEIDVAAILGGPVLRSFALGMNLDEDRVSFTPADEANAMDAPALGAGGHYRAGNHGGGPGAGAGQPR